MALQVLGILLNHARLSHGDREIFLFGTAWAASCKDSGRLIALKPVNGYGSS